MASTVAIEPNEMPRGTRGGVDLAATSVCQTAGVFLPDPPSTVMLAAQPT